MVNTTYISVDPNENGHFRGLHIVIVNPMNPKDIILSAVFDTYKSSEVLDQVIKESIEKGVPDGYIIIAACKDDCTTNLSDYAKNWFSSMGSTLIHNLEYRQSFAFIGKIGQKGSADEKSDIESTSITKVFKFDVKSDELSDTESEIEEKEEKILPKFEELPENGGWV